ncbi:hypothetical protein JTB14_003365 [Gonioctena quinquepunctata]|nr:hypothetical protein JTB14_003365 [Gonioctena quinquepunctata]
MSFLESINLLKDNLKKTNTFVTHVDGRVFKETKGQQSEFVGNHYGFVVDEKPDKIPAKVIDHIFLGSQDCCEIEILNEFDIKFVLSIGVAAPVEYGSITYKFVNCLDIPETDITQVLRECVPYIEKAAKQRSNLLVHCNAGVSRSSSVVIGYLIMNKNYGYSQAYDIVKTVRSCIKPNVGFEKQLQHLLNFV